MSAYRLVKAASKIVASEGFIINKHKTNIMRHPHRQIVTGLVVNKDVRISRNDLRKFRAFLHHCETKGLESVSKDIGKNAIEVARGYLSYINMISPELATTLSSKHLWISK